MTRPTWFFMALSLFLACGWACNKYGSSSSLSDSQVVATVDGKDITFGDWMRQVDLLRVLIPESRLNASDAQQVSQVLDTLINQKVILAALRKTNYSDPAFDQALQKKLVQAQLQLKEDKDQLEKDMQAVARLEKDYKDALSEYLLAQDYASNQKDSVTVTEMDIRNLYADYSKKYHQAGRSVPPYGKEVHEILKAELQADRMMRSIRTGVKIDRKEDVIKKYTDTLSPSRQILETGPSSAKPPLGPNDKIK